MHILVVKCKEKQDYSKSQDSNYFYEGNEGFGGLECAWGALEGSRESTNTYFAINMGSASYL